jgi:hypothetical protein
MMEVNISVDTSPSKGRIKVGVFCLTEYIDLRTNKDH